MIGRAPLLALALGLGLAASSAGAEEMTKEQEAAMTAIFQDSQSAGALFDAGKFPEAEAIFRSVLEKSDAAFPGEALMHAAALHGLAATLSEEGRLAEAEKLAKEALDLRTANNKGGPALVNSQALYASIIRELGRRAEATTLMQTAVAAMIGSPDTNPRDLISNASELVAMLAEDGRFKEAEQLAGDLLNLEAQLDDRQKIDVYWAAAALKSKSGHPADADRYYRQAYAILVKAFPDNLTRRAILISNIASVLRQEYRQRDAEQLFRRAAGDLEKLYPDGSPALATALDGLGLSIAEQNRPAEAWPIERQALDMRLKFLPEDHPLVATSLVNLGLSLLRDGQYEPARDAFQTAVARRQKLGDEVGAARAAVSLAVAQHALGDTAGGVQSLDNARSVFDEALPKGHPLATTAAINEAWFLLAEGDAAKALTIARQAADALAAGRAVAVGEGEATPPDEDKRRIVVAVAAAWDVAEGK